MEQEINGFMCFKVENGELIQFSNVFEAYEYAKKYAEEITRQLDYEIKILATIKEKE